MSFPAYITWKPDPDLFDFGFIAIRWYSLLFAAGFVVSFVVLKKRFSEQNISINILERLTIYVVLATVIGARLGHCLFYDFDYYRRHILEIFLPVEFSPKFRFTGFQGLASHGGAIGILTALWSFSRKYHFSFFWLADQLAIVIPFAGCCIRLGNLINSEIIGKPAHVPWAFIFIKADSVPRHPAQLYEVMAYLCIGGFIGLLTKNNQRKPGYIFGWFLVSLFTARFLIEFFKEDQSAFEAGMVLNMGQLLSIPLIILGTTLIIMKQRACDVLSRFPANRF